jgi:hypothetical protein
MNTSIGIYKLSLCAVLLVGLTAGIIIFTNAKSDPSHYVPTNESSAKITPINTTPVIQTNPISGENSSYYELSQLPTPSGYSTISDATYILCTEGIIFPAAGDFNSYLCLGLYGEKPSSLSEFHKE